MAPKLWLWATLAVATAHVYVLMTASLPPLHDYPAHLARIHIMVSLDQSSFLQRYYGYDWGLRPNLGADIAIFALAHVVPIEIAGRLVVAIIPALTILGVALIRVKVHGRIDSLILLSTPYAIGAWFSWGFLNFCVATALALIAFRLWLSARHKSPEWRICALMAMGFVVWTAHLVGWAVLCILIFAWELAEYLGVCRKDFPGLLRGALKAILISLPVAWPLILTIATMSDGGSSFAFTSRVWMMKAQAPLTSLAFMWDRADKYCVVLIAAFCISAMALRLVAVSPGLLLGALLLFAAFVLCPPSLSNASNIDVRILTPFALVATTAITWRTHERRSAKMIAIGVLTLAAAVCTLGRLTYTAIAIHRSQNEFERSLALIDHMPRGARVLVFTVDFLKGGRPPVVLLANMAVVRRDAFSNMQWQEDNGQPLRLAYLRTVPAFDNASTTVFQTVTQSGPNDALSRAVRDAPLAHFDYVWIANAHLAPPLRDARLHLVGSAERTTLYRVTSGWQ